MRALRKASEFFHFLLGRALHGRREDELNVFLRHEVWR